jgi:hypothetical protein
MYASLSACSPFLFAITIEISYFSIQMIAKFLYVVMTSFSYPQAYI